MRQILFVTFALAGLAVTVPAFAQTAAPGSAAGNAAGASGATGAQVARPSRGVTFFGDTETPAVNGDDAMTYNRPGDNAVTIHSRGNNTQWEDQGPGADTGN